MNDPAIDALLRLLERIAEALEAGNATQHDPAQVDRLIAVQERSVAAVEEHNRHHREQGLAPAEPKAGVVQ